MNSSTSSSSTGRFGKAPLALATAVVIVLGTAAPLAWTYGEYVAARHPDFTRTNRFIKFFAPRSDETPLVMTLGDSTLRSPIPFSTQVEAWIKEPLEMRTLWVLGLSQGEAALIVAGALELEPKALVLVAHFSMFESERPLRLRELQRLVPPHRLPEFVGLPYGVRGVGFAELVFSSLAGAWLPEPWIVAKRGGARWFESQLRRRWRVVAGSEDHHRVRLAQLEKQAIARSVRSFHEGHPSLEMIRASVRMAERSGVETLVVVSPVNRDAVEEAVGYDADAFLSTVETLRRVVRDEGGDLIDSHAALTREQFTDDLGHYYASGAREVAIPVETWTRSVLGYPPGPQRRTNADRAAARDGGAS